MTGWRQARRDRLAAEAAADRYWAEKETTPEAVLEKRQRRAHEYVYGGFLIGKVFAEEELEDIEAEMLFSDDPERSRYHLTLDGGEDDRQRVSVVALDPVGGDLTVFDGEVTDILMWAENGIRHCRVTVVQEPPEDGWVYMPDASSSPVGRDSR